MMNESNDKRVVSELKNTIYYGVTNNYDVRMDCHFNSKFDIQSVFKKLPSNSSLRGRLLDLETAFKLNRGEVKDIESILIKVFQAIPQLAQSNFNIASEEIKKHHEKHPFIPIAS